MFLKIEQNCVTKWIDAIISYIEPKMNIILLLCGCGMLVACLGNINCHSILTFMLRNSCNSLKTPKFRVFHYFFTFKDFRNDQDKSKYLAMEPF